MIEKQSLIELRKKVMQKEFSRMNNVQKKAVFHVNGPLLILAGAGSGKTTVLVNRIANLIEYGNAYNSDTISTYIGEEEVDAMNRYLSGGEELDPYVKSLLAVDSVKPWNILAITFTNKAAGELKERIENRVPEGGKNIWAATFHSTCARILRRYADRIGYTDKFTVYDTEDQKRLVKDCQKQLYIDDKILSFKSIIAAISRAKDSMISPAEYLRQAGTDTRKISISKEAEV